MEELKFDVMESLHSRYLDFICDQIFAYLDYDSLMNSKMVSAVWKKIVSKGEFWKVMVERKKKVLPYWKKVFDAVKVFKDKELLGLGNADASDERHCEYNHTMYCLVEDEIQKSVDSNWRSGGKHQRVKYESFGNDTFLVHGCECEVDSQSIVQLQQHSRIFIRNRWTLELEKVLEIPLTEINMNGRHPQLTRLKINSNFITASFCVHPEICVWDAKSHELLRVLKPVPEQGNQVEGEYGEFFVKGHCLWNDLLLSCYARISEADESFIVTLRRIPLNGDGEVTLLYYQKVLPKPVSFLEVAMDDDYIVLFVPKYLNFDMPSFSLEATFEIEIRSAVSYDVVHKISIPSSSPFQRFQLHYLNGFIVMGHTEENYFRIWSAADGRCVKTICYGDKGLSAIRIISDKYIVTCDDDGVLKIWDFQAALIRPEPFNCNLLIRKVPHLKAISRAASVNPTVVSSKVRRIEARKKTPRAPPIEFVGSTCLVADELQTILVSHSENGSSYLHVETFLNAAQ